MRAKPLDEEALFHAARHLADPEARALFIDQACGDNAGLAERVRALLEMHEQESDTGEMSSLQTRDYEPVAERPGARVGPYRLMEQIGEGGFGLVFVAEQQEPVKRKVALKIIKPGMDSQQVVARFEAERQALALMDHPNIARVLDAGATDSGRPYFVMELVRGIPITDYCDKNQLSPRERLELFITVCHAIQHAHQKGIIHRDIKPSNVLVTSHDGKPVAKVIDFGVAKAIHQHLTERTIYTQFAQMIGTPLYMSPEQAEMSGLDIDTRSDIYSLGVLLYELLTGTTPLAKKRVREATYDEVRRLIREEDPPKPSTRLSTSDSIAVAAQRRMEPAKLSKLVRGDLDWITMKALEKDRTRRYETANGLARDIQRYLSDEPVEASPPSATYRLRKFARKHRMVLTTAAAFLALVTAGAALATWQAVRATHAEVQALAANAQLDAAITELKTSNQNLDTANQNLKAINEKLDLARRAADKALPLFEETFKLTKANLGPDHPDTLASMNNLAAAYLATGKPDLALPLYEEALKLRKAKLGPDHPDTLTSMKNLAEAYRATGKPDLALPLYKETLKLRKAKLGPDHPDTLTSMNNLAAAYRATGKLDLALSFYEETLKLRKAKLGPDHPDTLTSMNNLAEAYRATGKLELALPFYEETLKLTNAKVGPDHPDTISSMNNLAEAYQAADKLDLALPLYEKTLKLMKVQFGPDHPDTLTSMNNLALGYQHAGKLNLALPLFQQAAAGMEKRRFKNEDAGLLGPPLQHQYFVRFAARWFSPDGRTLVAASRDNTARVWDAATGKPLGPPGGIVGNLIACQEQLKQFEEAETWRRKWLAVVKERSGADSLAYAGELAALGLNLLQQKKSADAEAVLRECLGVRQQKAADVWTTFNTQSMLGASLLGQKKYKESEPLLTQGYEGMKRREKTIPPQGKPRIIEAAERLVELYEATRRQDEARKWTAVVLTLEGKLIETVHNVEKELTFKGELETATPALIYRVRLRAGVTYVMDMVSPDPKALDPYLVLQDADRKTLAEDDDPVGNLNARITFRAPADGIYRLRATSFGAGRGPFTLTVRAKD
jgi:non-specific serine/threonine protein kinase/serine/threonine-protein kinase